MELELTSNIKYTSKVHCYKYLSQNLVQDRAMRAKTEAFEREALREAIRATSEIRRDVTPSPVTNEEERQTNKYIDEAHRRADQVIYRHRYLLFPQKISCK